MSKEQTLTMVRGSTSLLVAAEEQKANKATWGNYPKHRLTNPKQN